VGDDNHVVFGQQFPGEKEDGKMVPCQDATASSFIAKFQGEVFTKVYVVTVKCHSGMWNWLFGLPGSIICKTSPYCQRK
jgi:hypothetical protein